MQQTPQPRLRKSALIAGGVVIVGLGAAILYGPGMIPLPALPDLPTPAPAVEVVQLPEEFSQRSPIYGKDAPKKKVEVWEPPIVAQSTQGTASSVPAALPGGEKGILQQINPFDGVMNLPKPAQDLGNHTGGGVPKNQVATPTVKEKPKPKRWEALAKATVASKNTTETTQAVGSSGTKTPSQASSLITPAEWAIPADPLHTIYESMTLEGELLQVLHSDIQGQLLIRLTIPVFDKFGYDVTILPKGTLVVAYQDEKPEYGQTRLKVRLKQLELPSGEVVRLSGTVGDEDGSNGLSGKVNNHYGKLALATGISAVLNIGARSLVGTPGTNQFFQNPAQQAAQDIGSDVQQSAKGIVDRELKIPPTISRKAMTFCSIKLDKNIQFNRPPIVAQ